MVETNQGRHTLRGVVCVLLGGCCWAFSGSCGQYLFIHSGVSPVWLTAVRMLLAGCLNTLYMIVYHRAKIKALISRPRDCLIMLFYAIFGLMLTQYTYFEAIRCTNAGTATVLEYIGPVLIMVIVCIGARRLPTIKESIAIVCVVLGIFLIATHGRLDTLIISPEGLFWGLFSSVAMVFYTLLPRSITPKYGAVMVTGLGTLLGGIAFFLLMRPWPLIISLPPESLLALGGIVFIGTIAAFPLYLQGVNDLGAVKASMLASIEPVAATVFSVVWLGSTFVLQDLLGFACIIATVYLLAEPGGEKSPETP